MSSSLPIVRQAAWLSIVPQLAILLMLVALADTIVKTDDPLLVGLIVYFVLFIALRQLIPYYHRKGIRRFKQERFVEAIPYFEKSYDFFSRHLWVDRWRAITVLSSSRISYREMALLNIAFCLAQSGEQQKAKTEYRRVLEEFPGSKMAETALRMMEPSNTGTQQSVSNDEPSPG